MAHTPVSIQVNDTVATIIRVEHRHCTRQTATLSRASLKSLAIFLWDEIEGFSTPIRHEDSLGVTARIRHGALTVTDTLGDTLTLAEEDIPHLARQIDAALNQAYSWTSDIERSVS